MRNIASASWHSQRTIPGRSRAGQGTRSRVRNGYGRSPLRSNDNREGGCIRHDIFMAASRPGSDETWRPLSPKHQEPIMAVKPIPEGFHSVTPYLTVRGADKV